MNAPERPPPVSAEKLGKTYAAFDGEALDALIEGLAKWSEVFEPKVKELLPPDLLQMHEALEGEFGALSRQDLNPLADLGFVDRLFKLLEEPRYAAIVEQVLPSEPKNKHASRVLAAKTTNDRSPS